MKTLAVVLLLAFLLACRHEDRSGKAGPNTALTPDDSAPNAELAQEEKQLTRALATTRAALRDARTIELYEVANQFDADFEQIRENQQVAGYPIRRKLEISAAAAAPLAEVLTARSTYFEPGNGWMCIFEPHHVLRAVSTEQTVEVVICLKCGDVSFAESGRQIILKSVRPGSSSKLTSLVEGLTRGTREATMR